MERFTKTIGTFIISISLVSTAFADTTIGQTTFENSCASCHTGGFKGMMSGAPNVKKPEKWAQYLKNDEASMQAHIIDGSDKHEAMGGCDACSAEEVRAAVSYIRSMVQ